MIPPPNDPAKATPTPWHLNEISTAGFYSALICADEKHEAVCIASLQDMDVETEPKQTKSNAAFIVEACNAYTSLKADLAAARLEVEVKTSALRDLVSAVHKFEGLADEPDVLSTPKEMRRDVYNPDFAILLNAFDAARSALTGGKGAGR